MSYTCETLSPLTSNGFPVLDSDGNQVMGCKSWVDLPSQVADLGVNATDIGFALTWGFTAVLLGWVFGYAIRIAVNLIKAA